MLAPCDYCCAVIQCVLNPKSNLKATSFSTFSQHKRLFVLLAARQAQTMNIVALILPFFVRFAAGTLCHCDNEGLSSLCSQTCEQVMRDKRGKKLHFDFAVAQWDGISTRGTLFG